MRVHTDISGNDDGVPVVCTHGIGADLHTFDRLAELLAPHHRVVRWDLPGHGRSEAPTDPAAYERDLVLADFDDVVEVAGGPPILVGHSLGGYLTLAWAITRPGRAAGLCAVATGPGFRDATKRAGWNDMVRRNAHRFGVNDAAAGLNLQHDDLVIANLGRLDLPVELVVGDADNGALVAGMSYIEAKVSDATLTVVTGGEHLTHEADGAETVAAAVRRLAHRVVPT